MESRQADSLLSCITCQSRRVSQMDVSVNEIKELHSASRLSQVTGHQASGDRLRPRGLQLRANFT